MIAAKYYRKLPRVAATWKLSETHLTARGITYLIVATFGVSFIGSLPKTNPLIASVSILAIFVSGIAVHEVGHLMTALLLDFRVLAVSVGPLRIAKEDGRLRFRRNREIAVGGMVSGAPKNADHVRWRMLLITLAGPGMSLVVGAAAIVLGVEAENSGSWILCWGIASVFLGAISSIPAQKFYVSDGARVYMLLRDTPQADRCCAHLLISAAAMSGVRPRDWDRNLVDMLLAVRDSTGDTVAADVMAYEAAMDRKDFDQAKEFLSAALAARASCPLALKSGLALDAALFESAVSGNATEARKWLSECDPKLIVDRYYLLLVEAAVLLAEQHPAEAREKASQCLQALPQAQFPGFAKASEDWARMLLTRAQAQMTATTSE